MLPTTWKTQILRHTIQHLSVIVTSKPSGPRLWVRSDYGCRFGSDQHLCIYKHLRHALTHAISLAPQGEVAGSNLYLILDPRSGESGRLPSSESGRLDLALTFSPLSATSVLLCPAGLCGPGAIPKSMPAEIKRGKQCRKQMPEAVLRGPDPRQAL